MIWLINMETSVGVYLNGRDFATLKIHPKWPHFLAVPSKSIIVAKTHRSTSYRSQYPTVLIKTTMPIDWLCVCFPCAWFPCLAGAEHCWCLCEPCHHVIPCLPCLPCAAASSRYLPTDFPEDAAKQEEVRYLELEEASSRTESGNNNTLLLGPKAITKVTEKRLHDQRLRQRFPVAESS